VIAVRLEALNDFTEWRGKARQLLIAGVRPDTVVWRDPGSENGLFEAGDDMLPIGDHPVGSVPPRFLALGEQVVCHSDPTRFGLLYRFLWRLLADRLLMETASDPDLVKLTRFAGAVRRDSHKMKAFVRFREMATGDDGEQFLAWFEPDHYVLEPTAPFFARRFAGMRWGIVTPYRSAFWDGEQVVFAPGGNKADVPSDDAVEDVWRTYFASIFNPARLKVRMMKSEMPVKYWRNLPEADLISPLIRGARGAEADMIARAASEPPSRHLRQVARAVAEPSTEEAEIGSLAEARVAVEGCRRCPLYEHATQAVFGEGPEHAEMVFVGEQPGDQEDLSGKPFVGPAGQVFDSSLKRVGIDRSRVYVTNAVKHFKFVPRGKRRIHQRPDGGEIAACRFWLGLELDLVRPKVVVALGATAAQSLLGKAVTISKVRGAPIIRDDGLVVFVTNHPSYLLRIPDREMARVETEKFEADLKAIRDHVLRPAA
jgi:probable DNA metabolism protein